MSTLIPQHLVDAQAAGVKQLFAFSSSAFDGLEKLTALNLQVVKATLSENHALLAKALTAKPEELLELSTSVAKPTAEKFAAYNRHFYDILAGVHAALFATTPPQYQQYQQEAQGFVDNVTRNASIDAKIVVAE